MVTSPTPTAAPRLMSVDALRGFDLLWILGMDAVVYALYHRWPNPVTGGLNYEMDHAEWGGFHFYDLIFPLFVFITGMSVVFSLGKLMAAGGRREALKRLVRRSALLFACGIIYNGGLAHAWPGVRLMGVLQRMAIVYLVAGFLFCYFRPRTLAGVAAALLVGYWSLMTFVPIRDIQVTKDGLAAMADAAGDAKAAARFHQTGRAVNAGTQALAEKYYYGVNQRITGSFEPGRNLADHLDFLYLRGNKYDTFYDPEGILSQLPAVATGLLGVLAGSLLLSRRHTDNQKLWWLVAGGAVAVALGWAWHLEFPVIKKIWTSSFVLVAGGYSAWLLAFFYWVVDVRQWRGWCQPLVWIGTNAITLYLLTSLLNGFDQLAERLVGGSVKQGLDSTLGAGTGELVVALVALGLVLLLARFLYRHKLFLRL